MKNSVFMAFRMFVSMGVSLYTSRVVLQQLGLTDFGIFNVVGSLSVMMAFFTGALITAIQRFYNIELGEHGGRAGVQKVFSASLACIFAIVLLFLLFSESVGLWLLNEVLSIPEGHYEVAGYAYQLSLAIVICEMFRVPYNALIIAYEKMAFYAYNSLVETGLKLLTILLLSLAGGQKLVSYMWLLVGVAIMINASYMIYVHRYMRAIRFVVRADRKVVGEIGRFIGWNMLSAVSNVAHLQGSAMLVNVFFGVAFNATIGIANQIKTAVTSVARSVHLAGNPQMIQNYASGEHGKFVELLIRVTKIAVGMVLLTGIPVVFNIEYILSVWLTEIPPATVPFVKLMVLFCVIYALSEPLKDAILASGTIAKYQLLESICWIMSLPLIYVVFRVGFESYYVLVVLNILGLIVFCVRLMFASRLCDIRKAQFVNAVLLRLTVVVAVAIVPTWLVGWQMDSGILRLLITSGLWCLMFASLFYLVGMTRTERNGINSVVNKMLFRKSKQHLT